MAHARATKTQAMARAVISRRLEWSEALESYSPWSCPGPALTAQRESSTIANVAGRKEARSTAAPDFYVGPWLAEPARNLLRDRTTSRHLEPQVMDLLVFLANTAGRVVSK